MLDNPATQFPAPDKTTSVSEEPIPPTSPRRRGRPLAKPFVDPAADERPSPKKEANIVSPVKNPSRSPKKAQPHEAETKSDIEFSEFLKDEVVESFKVEVKETIKEEHGIIEREKIVAVGISVEEETPVSALLSTSTEVITPEETTPTKPTSGKPDTPFSRVNFFQSGSPSAHTPKSQLKRPLEDEDASSRKKHEATADGPVPQTPAAVDESVNYSMFETPDQPPEPSSTYTVPHVRNSSSFTEPPAGSFSVGKPANSLRGTGTGRRISFMPTVDQLQMSDEFSRQLGTPSKGAPVAESSPVAVPSSPGDETISEYKEPEEEAEVEEKAETEEEVEVEAEAEEEDLPEPVSKRNWRPFLQALGLSILVVILSSFSKWYVQEKFEAGFCDPSIHRPKPFYTHLKPETWQGYFGKEYLGERTSQMLDYVRPECEPCPAHAVCFPGFRVECEPNFIKVVSPLSLGGVLPIAPVCQPDTQKEKRVQMMADKALEILRDRNAKVECGTLNEAAIEENELRDILYNMKTATLTDEDFNELWIKAMNDIENEEEIIVR